MRGPKGSETAWVAGAVLASAVYSLLVLVLPSSGVTFLWDDWTHLQAIVEKGPRAILEALNVHWTPIFRGLLALEYGAFGASYMPYLIVNWAIHVGNIFLLARVLGTWAADARAGALAAAAFGVATSYRILFWWPTGASQLICFTFTAAAFMAFESWRARGQAGLPWKALAAIVGALLSNGAGIAVGPALALDAVVTLPREKNRRVAAAALLVWGLTVIGCVLAVEYSPEGRSPHLGSLFSSERLIDAGMFSCEAIGLGFVRQVAVLPVSGGPIVGVALAFVYVLVLVILLYALSPVARRRLLLAHAYLVALLLPMAFFKASYVWNDRPNAAQEHYQYLPGFVWGTALALTVARLSLLSPWIARLGAIGLVVLLGSRHRETAFWDRNYFAPEVRRELHERELVDALVAAVARARGPVYDAPLPRALAWEGTRARDVVAVVAPVVTASWTEEPTAESTAPLVSDVFLAKSLGLR
jgi:hypothetical protein